jgi:XTP/dITP diphosphohydrolase
VKLVLASNNKGKLAELQRWLPAGISALRLADIGFSQVIDEPFDSFRENACIKAKTVFDFCGLPTLSDDSGICADALGGRPGVHSARFAGDGASDQQNNQKLLASLCDTRDRDAHYTAVLCFINAEGARYFEGRCDGQIGPAPVGEQGFGYDPIFIPQGFSESFAQLAPELKGRISHRARALQQFVAFLNEHPGTLL